MVILVHDVDTMSATTSVRQGGGDFDRGLEAGMELRPQRDLHGGKTRMHVLGISRVHRGGCTNCYTTAAVVFANQEQFFLSASVFCRG